MRKLLAVAGLTGALVALPVGSLTTTAGASTAHAFKGKGAGSLTLTGSQFAADGTISVARVGKIAFHSSGTEGAGRVAYTTTFTAPNGDTVTTSSHGTARHTRVGRVYTTTDSVTGGTGRFADASGLGRTAAKVALAPGATTGTVKLVLGGKIRF
jgi:hypothetical protein